MSCGDIPKIAQSRKKRFSKKVLGEGWFINKDRSS